MAIPTVADVDRIAGLTNPVIRNLQITQCYYELAAALMARTGIGANWCTFATWASRQVGQTIRKEDLRRVIEDALRLEAVAMETVPDVVATAQAFGSKRTHEEIQESVADVLNPLAGLDRASAAMARGNKKVFEEIGREFARFLATCLNDLASNPATMPDFCEALRTGDPPEGQQYLRNAFARYYQALYESNPKTRAELMFLANLEIGFHEQMRLQPEIAEAMNAFVMEPRQFRVRLIKALFPYRGWLARLRLFLLRLSNHPSPFDTALEALAAEACRQSRLILTHYVLIMGLPHGLQIRLGEDIPATFPPSLEYPVLPDLRTLLEKLDPAPDSTLGSGALDWASLPDRMCFIADLFRCYHESPDLYEPPFTPEQTAILKAGYRPEGML